MIAKILSDNLTYSQVNSENPKICFLHGWGGESSNWKNISGEFESIALDIPGFGKSVPFEKSFFAGGSNDNRAWTAYNLGPGRSDKNNEFSEANFKIAFSLEHRYKLFGKLNGAFFIDAGNIWNVLDDVEDSKAIFNSFKSLNDIAIGAGIGLRYDFDFFILRFDSGLKAYNPAYAQSRRWLRDFNFKNAVYNIGINYPF